MREQTDGHEQANTHEQANGRSVGIVGAGPGGLAAAVLLAASGAQVTVYESRPTVGGRTSRLTLHGQGGRVHHFDRGPTFFLMPYVLEEVFAAAGRRLSDYATMTRLDPMYRLVFAQADGPSVTLDCTQDAGVMAARLGAIEPRDGAAFEGFLEENRAKLRAFEPVLRKPFGRLLDALDGDLLRAAPRLKPWRSVHGDLSVRFRSPLVRLALSFQSKYLGMSPYACPSLFTILPLIEYQFGVWHPAGGCNALMGALAEVAAELGAQVRCGHPVRGLGFEGDRCVGVRTDAGEHRHDQVILNADASHAMRTLIPPGLRRRWSDRKLDGMKHSCSTYMLYLGLRQRLDLPHHTICISERYRENLADLAEPGRLSERPSMYFCNASATDPGLSPNGGSGVYVLVPTPNCRSGIDWDAARPRLRAAAMDKLAELAGRRVEGLVEVEHEATPDDWRAQGIQFGATFNLAHGLDQMLMFRPQHELPDVRGVWLVGGGTHPGSGLPVIFLSAQITARLVCQRLGLAYSGDGALRARAVLADRPDAGHAHGPALGGPRAALGH